MDPCASDTREFVSSWRCDPTAREDELVAAQVQFRSATRVAERRDARATRRRAIEAGAGGDKEGGCDGDVMGVVDDDEDARGGFSDAEDHLVGEHQQRGSASPLARVRPLSASHVRARPTEARRSDTVDARHVARARPQSAKVSRRSIGISTSPVRDFAWMPKPMKQSKWTEMLQHGPRFQEHNLQRLEAETYALLEQVLRGPKTQRALRGGQGKDQEGRRRTDTQTAQKGSAKKTRVMSAGPAVGSGLQVARSNKKMTAQATKGTAVSSQTLTKSSAPARDSSIAIERRVVIEKTKSRTKAITRPRCKKNDIPAELTEKERKKSEAEAEASAKVMREMGWLEELSLSDDPPVESESGLSEAKRSSSKKKKKKKHVGSRLATDSKPAAKANPPFVEMDDHMNGQNYEATSWTKAVAQGAQQQDTISFAGDEAFRATLEAGVSPRILDEDAYLSPRSRETVHVTSPQVESPLSVDHDVFLPNTNGAVKVSDLKHTEKNDLVHVVSDLKCPNDEATIKQFQRFNDDDLAPVGAADIASDVPKTPFSRSYPTVSVPEVCPDDVQPMNEHTIPQEHADHKIFPHMSPHGGAAIKDAQLGQCASDTPTARDDLPTSDVQETSVAQDTTTIQVDEGKYHPLVNCQPRSSSGQSHIEPELALPERGSRDTSGIPRQDPELGRDISVQKDIDLRLRAHEQCDAEPTYRSSSSHDHDVTPQKSETSNEGVAADDYAEEFCEEETMPIDPTVEITRDVFEDQSKNADAVTVSIHGGWEDANLLLTETEYHVSASSPNNLARADRTTEVLRTSNPRRWDQHQDGIPSLEVTRGVERIKRQYRAFCNRRIILEQVKYLSRKKRRAERKKSRDVGGRLPARPAAVDVCSAAGALVVDDSSQTRSKSIDSSRIGDDDAEAASAHDFTGQAVPADCRKHDQLDQIDKWRVHYEQPRAISAFHDLGTTVDDVQEVVEQTAVLNCLIIDDQKDTLLENDQASAPGNRVLLQNTEYLEITVNQQQKVSPSQLLQDGVEDTGEKGYLLTEITQRTRSNDLEVFAMERNDESTIDPCVRTKMATGESLASEHTSNNHQARVNCTEDTCLSEEVMNESKGFAEDLPIDRLASKCGATVVTSLSGAQDRTPSGDYAVCWSPRPEASLDHHPDVGDESVCVIESESTFHSPLQGHLPMVVDATQPDLTVNEDNCLLAETVRIPSVVFPSPAVTHELNVQSAVTTIESELLSQDNEASSFVVAEDVGRVISYSNLTMLQPVDMESGEVDSRTDGMDNSGSNLQHTTLEPPPLFTLQHETASEAPIAQNEAGNEPWFPLLSNAAGQIQRAWREYSSRPAPTQRQDPAAIEIESDRDTTVSRAVESPLTSCETNAERALRFKPLTPYVVTDVAITSKLPDESEREQAEDVLTGHNPHSREIDTLSSCGDFCQPEDDGQDADTAPVSLRHDAARGIQNQYRRHVYRRDLLEQLAFFVRQHRRETRKKSRRLSGGLVPRLSTDLTVESDRHDASTPGTLLESQGDATTTACIAEKPTARSQLDTVGAHDQLASSTPSNSSPTNDGALSVERSQALDTQLAANEAHEEERDSLPEPLNATGTEKAHPSPTRERYMDSGANKSFYCNPEKQLSQWDRPVGDAVVDRTLESATVNQATDSDGGGSGVDVTLTSDAQDQWERYKDTATNKTFYFHRASQVSQWDRPIDTAVVDAVELAAGSHQSTQELPNCRAEAVSSDTACDERSAIVMETKAPDDAEMESGGDDARWTLRRNRSLRGDRRGEWQAFADPETHQTFYYNSVSGESSWEKPAAFSEATRTTPASYEWVMYVDAATAQPYYVNLLTNATSWERPADFDEAVSAEDLSRLRGIREQREEMAAMAVDEADGDPQHEDDYVISIQDDQDAAEWLAL